MDQKHCPKCGRDKPLSAFSPNRTKSSGYNSYCKPCLNAVINARRERLRDPNKPRKIKPPAAPTGYKWCPDCEQIKPVTDFSPRTQSRPGQYSAYCRPCSNARSKVRYPISHWRSAYLRRVYGISEAQYDALLDQQQSLCALCGKPQQSMRKRSHDLLAVDHDHQTGQLRGLLCDKCNRGLGHFDDSPDLLARAIAYLNSYRSVSLECVNQ